MSKELTLKLGRLLRAVRKMKGLPQKEVCQSLNLTQGTLSKIESGILMPRINLWFDFCGYYDIDPNSYYIGVIDNFKTLKTKDVTKVGLFTIPNEIGYSSSIGVRSIASYIKLLEFNISNDVFLDFCKDCNIDPDYFLGFDNTINYNFEFKLIELLVKKRILTASKMSKLSKAIENPEMSGVMLKNFESFKTPEKSLKYFLKNYNKYNSGLNLEIEEEKNNSLIVHVAPKEEISHFDFSNLKSFYHKMLSTTIEATPRLADPSFKINCNIIDSGKKSSSLESHLEVNLG